MIAGATGFRYEAPCLSSRDQYTPQNTLVVPSETDMPDPDIRATLGSSGKGRTMAAEEHMGVSVSGQRISDEAVRKRTGRGWDEWFALLDSWGATGLSHAGIARRIVAECGTDEWWAQSITVGYEQARDMRKPGQVSDGTFAASASKTIGVGASEAFAAFSDETQRAKWLPDVALVPSTVNPPKSFRAECEDGTRVSVWITEKGERKSAVSLQHEKLGEAQIAAEKKAFWRDRLDELKSLLEG